MYKSDKIRRFLAKGLSPSEIAKKLKTDVNYVYTLKWEDRKKGVTPQAKKYKKPSKIVKAVDETTNVQRPKYRMLASIEPSLSPLERRVKNARDFVNAHSDLVSPDIVNHPPHYRAGGIETLDFIEAKDLNFRLGNVVKYVSRAGKKSDSDPIKDLEKAAFYLNREIAARKSA